MSAYCARQLLWTTDVLGGQYATSSVFNTMLVLQPVCWRLTGFGIIAASVPAAAAFEHRPPHCEGLWCAVWHQGVVNLQAVLQVVHVP